VTLARGDDCNLARGDGHSGSGVRPGLRLLRQLHPLHGHYTSDTDYVYSIDVQGALAALVLQGGAVELLDLSEPDEPQHLSEIGEGWWAVDLVLEGSYLYVVRSDSLTVVSIADPSNPVALATCYAGVYIQRGELAGRTMVLADNTIGLRVVDVTDPHAPALVATVDTSYGPYDVDVFPGDRYVAMGSYQDWVKIIDLEADPPAVIHTISGLTSPWGVAIAGDYLAVLTTPGTYNNALTVFEYISPTEFEEKGTVSISGGVENIEGAGDLVYLAATSHGLRAVNIGNPDAPELLGTYPLSGYCIDLALTADRIYTAIAYTVSGVDVLWRGIEDFAIAEQHATLSVPMDVAVGYDQAYVADMDAGVVVVDLAAGGMIVNTEPVPGWPTSITLDHDMLYVTTDEGGFHCVYLDDFQTPLLYGTLEHDHVGISSQISGDYAFVALEDVGLLVANVSDPFNPAAVTTLPVPGGLSDLTLVGDYLYGVSGWGSGPGLVVIDVSDPENPFIAAQPDDGVDYGGALDVGIYGPYAYVAQREGLHCFHVGDPTSPVDMGRIVFPRPRSIGIVIHEHFAYVSGYSFGIHVINLQEPTEPMLVGTILGGVENDTGARKSAVWGDYIVTADEIGYLLKSQRDCEDTMDIEHPEAPLALLLHSYPNPCRAGASFSFRMPTAGHAQLCIYDAAGRHVATPLSGPEAAGLRLLRWDGCDSRGQHLPSGVYLVRFRAGDLVSHSTIRVIR